MVADLGDEEMVACVLDDGDLIAWWTKPIKDWLTGPLPRFGDDYLDILVNNRPFLHQTFDKGAWGIAAHTKARMLAASSNDFTVRVFAFGLNSVETDTGEADDLQQDWQVYRPSSGTGTMNRSSNVQIVLRGHEANIPSISFCNSHDDPAGKYLVSTDISGRVIIWNVHQACSIREIRDPGADPRAFHRLQAGWGAFWVDFRAFCRTTIEKTGVHNVYASNTEARSVLDLSRSKATVRRTGWWSIGDSSESSERSNDDRSASTLMTSQGSQMDAAHEDVLFGGSSDEDTELDAEEEETLNDTIMASQYLNRHVSFCHHEVLVTTPAGVSNADLPPCPLIFTNPFSMCLLQPLIGATASGKPQVTNPFHPAVLIRQLLDQDMDLTWKSRLAYYERLNICVPIPELGVLLVGSPTGRVAVLTLHQFLPQSQLAAGAGRPVYTLRLDHLLPFSSQEAAGLRPAVQLVGVAAAPLQGHERRLGARTWRVVLLYKDGRILNYEIDPAAGAGAGGAGGVDVLLV